MAKTKKQCIFCNKQTRKGHRAKVKEIDGKYFIRGLGALITPVREDPDPYCCDSCRLDNVGKIKVCLCQYFSRFIS
jgi:molybdenum cofactor biosynthesis enzyme MoaA